VFNWSDGWNMTAEQMPTVLLGNGPFPVQGITATRFPGLQAADILTAEQVLNDLAGSIHQLTQGFIQNKATQTTWDDWNTEARRFRKFTQNDWAMFFKDSWNVTGNLTLNIGARYDKYGVFYEANGLRHASRRGATDIRLPDK
jgi:outer membrane receptor protein involved in Fe transport